MHTVILMLLGLQFACAGTLKLKPLSADERKLLSTPGVPKVAGVHRPLPADAITNGSWRNLPNGEHQWRLEIVSPGASSLRVEFASFQVGEGKVRVCEKDGKRCYGPYTAQTLIDNGSFWSDVVDGDTIVIEFTTSSRPASLPFRLARLSHMK